MGLSVPLPKTVMDELAQGYRTDQARMAAKSALRVGQMWEGVEVGNEASESNFVQLAVAELSAGYRMTADASADFVRSQVGDGLSVPEPNVEQMAASMGYVGPILARRAMAAGTDFEMSTSEARSHVKNQVRGAAVRLSALGGREVVRSVVDGKRIGYARVTGYDPCYFCAILASRRAVYEEDSFDESDARFTGWGTVKVHDSCQCALIPVTQMNQDQLTQMSYFEQLWKDLSGKNPKKRGESPVLTFRRNYEALRKAA